MVDAFGLFGGYGFGDMLFFCKPILAESPFPTLVRDPPSFPPPPSSLPSHAPSSDARSKPLRSLPGFLANHPRQLPAHLVNSDSPRPTTNILLRKAKTKGKTTKIVGKILVNRMFFDSTHTH
jgi:hypothetical protein